MNEQLRQALAASDAFTAYLNRSPALAEDVIQKMVIVEYTMYSAVLVDLQACRDALYGLFGIAQEGDFPALATLFYEGYELCCTRLLGYLEENAA